MQIPGAPDVSSARKFRTYEENTHNSLM